jgi:hypothetical protein
MLFLLKVTQALYAECRYAECRYAECRYDECRYDECLYAECCCAECRYVECRYAECRGAVHLTISFFRQTPQDVAAKVGDNLTKLFFFVVTDAVVIS